VPQAVKAKHAVLRTAPAMHTLLPFVFQMIRRSGGYVSPKVRHIIAGKWPPKPSVVGLFENLLFLKSFQSYNILWSLVEDACVDHGSPGTSIKLGGAQSATGGPSRVLCGR
jgi:hypothetical protein